MKSNLFFFLLAASATAMRAHLRAATAPHMLVSSGLTFESDGIRLVSLQKPLGLVLEDVEGRGGVVVAEVAPGSNADRAGVLVGDLLIAVNNLDVSSASVDAAVHAIGAVPGRVVNLRFESAARDRSRNS